MDRTNKGPPSSCNIEWFHNLTLEELWNKHLWASIFVIFFWQIPKIIWKSYKVDLILAFFFLESPYLFPFPPAGYKDFLSSILSSTYYFFLNNSLSSWGEMESHCCFYWHLPDSYGFGDDFNTNYYFLSLNIDSNITVIIIALIIQKLIHCDC